MARDNNDMEDSLHVAEGETVRTTIVGARPPGGGREVGAIPRGIEVLVKKAAVDPEFSKVLLEKRADAATDLGLELTLSEKTMLNAIPVAHLERIVDNTTVPDHQRRSFLGRVAAAMLTVVCYDMPHPSLMKWLFPVEKPKKPASDDPRCVYVSAGHRTKDRKSDPVPLSAPPAMPCRVKKDTEKPLTDEASKRLEAIVLYNGANELSLRVLYECPFEKGEITLELRPGHRKRSPEPEYRPPRLVVSRGSGTGAMTVTGGNGTTDWLIVRLRGDTASCRRSPGWNDGLPADKLSSGNYTTGDCVVWRVLDFHKEWPSKK